jgi:hypothetical protein
LPVRYDGGANGHGRQNIRQRETFGLEPRIRDPLKFETAVEIEGVHFKSSLYLRRRWRSTLLPAR